MTALATAGAMTVLTFAVQGPTVQAGSSGSAPAAGPAVSPGPSPALTQIAGKHPRERVSVIVQLRPGTDAQAARSLVRSHGGRVLDELPIINGLVAKMGAAQAKRLTSAEGIKAVSLNAPVRKTDHTDQEDGDLGGLLGNLLNLDSSFNQSIDADEVWGQATGKDVGVAVIDTGIAGNLRDFRVSQSNSRSRVIGAAVTNPYARTATDKFGHGTHVAGIIGGNSLNRSSSDRLRGKYVGVAPDANLISVKVADDDGGATVLDVIYGLQFVVDHKDDYDIRVANLSLESTVSESYKTDPLDAAVESAWFNGIVVVAAAGNRGDDSDAVKYAPGNDPYVITVGGVDDMGTDSTHDDRLADWSSRGRTQDGYSKPEVVAPGAHITSLLAPNSDFKSLCPSCIVSGEYMRIGGTSMAAPMVSGAVALMLEENPRLTPNQVKGAILETTRYIRNAGEELEVDDAIDEGDNSTANRGLTPNRIVNPNTGDIDYSRSRWSRSRWSEASAGKLGAEWARSRWSCDCYSGISGSVEETRSRWSRSRWSMSFSKEIAALPPQASNGESAETPRAPAQPKGGDKPAPRTGTPKRSATPKKKTGRRCATPRRKSRGGRAKRSSARKGAPHRRCGAKKRAR
jgi:serine protease AprX